MKIATVFTIALLSIFHVEAQVINAYAKATAQAGDVFTLSVFDQSNHNFVVGEYAVIMQMQDDVIGGNTGDNATFGNLATIQNAGYYEIREIVSINGNGTAGFSAGTPTQVTFTGTVGNYNFGANAAVQIISFRRMAVLDYTSTGNMAALDWDGDIGGVVALEVPGVFTLNHNISADEAGFRGAGPNAGGSAGCSGGANYRVNSQADFADKGEGIYLSTTANHSAGMGKILNGGGGGNSHNGGGGGGGNYSAGGDAGPGWPTCSPSAGGLGGIALQPYISTNRIFMGGGGGAGEGNNNLATDGGNGGGIILVKADEITTDACTGVSITSNGEDISFAGNDGGGGGGAAGSIVFDVNTWNITGGCPLNIEANGGDGGSVNSGATHGGGGGGGQGTIIFSNNVPTTNITTDTDNGIGGCDNNSTPCNSQAGNGTGVDDTGIIGNFNNPLPVELIDFEAAKLTFKSALLTWSTASETNNNYFTVLKSKNAVNWESIGTVEGAGNSNSLLNYEFKDVNLDQGITYYKIRQTDFDGNYSDTQIESVLNDRNVDFSIYPNPFNGELTVLCDDEIKGIQVYHSNGKLVYKNVYTNYQKESVIDLSANPRGLYFIQVTTTSTTFVEKITKQ